MKTFEEALRTVVVTGESPKELEAGVVEMRKVTSRYMAIAEEIKANECVTQIGAAISSISSPELALIAMFINGVIVGMEMEKQT